MSSLSFLHPALLAGAIAVSVPIAIHLLNRSRYKTVDWAAMDFLFSAHRRTRKRVKMEHWLVLLLRCLAILLLAALVARPALTPRRANTASAAALPQGTEHVIVLDDSPSMDARGALQTPFDTARGQIREWIDSLAENRPADTVTIIPTSAPDKPLCRRFSPSARERSRLHDMIESLKTVDAPRDAGRIAASLRPETEDKGRIESQALYWFTDLRAADWQVAPGRGRTPADELGALAEDAALVAVVDCGAGNPRNLAITAVEPATPALVANIPADYRVSVANYCEEPAENVEVSFGVRGGARHPAVIRRIGPGETETVLCRITPGEAGWLPVEASVGDDDLPADNTGRASGPVVPAIRVLSVHGSPDTVKRREADFFVRMALAPPGLVRLGYRITRVPAADLESVNLSDFDMMILCDVRAPAATETNAIERWVAEGGGLICFPGAATDTDSWNVFLHRDGAGPLPAKLERIEQPERDGWASMTVANRTHPIARVFSGEANPFLERVQIRRWWHTTAPAGDGIICKLNNPDASPVILEKRFGKGTVYMVNTAPDETWGNWVSDPSFLVVIQQMSALSARGSDRNPSVRAGDPILDPLDIAAYAAEVRMQGPDDPAPLVVALTPSAKADGMVLKYEDTGRQGWYTATLARRDGETETRYYAVNSRSAESDLRRAPEQPVRESLQAANVRFVTRMADAIGSLRAARTELWKPVAWILLAVLAAEHALSWWFLRRRTEPVISEQ